MSKINLCVIMGGMSTEHDVSLVSGTSVIEHLDKEKYNIFPIYIDNEGIWYKYIKPINEIKTINVGEKLDEIEKLDNVIEALKQMDIVFPVLHGLYGEDGTIQGFLELLNVKYVGCKVLASSVSMDKVYTKALLEIAEIPQAKYIYLKRKNKKYYYINNKFDEKEINEEKICNLVEEKLGLPVFVKPSNSGSSVGINKSKNREQLIEHINYAAQFDNKILIEENINGREIECAVMGTDEIKASGIGEIISADEFYSFDAKYIDKGSKTVFPTDIATEKVEEIRNLAIKVFKVVDGNGLARVDFFIRESDGKILVNELNTMPGFTSISMYPKLWDKSGISYSKLLDILIRNELD